MAQQTPFKVVFILQSNFSFVTFTGALDVLVTANLLSSDPVVEFYLYGVDSGMVTSDLGLTVAANGALDSLSPALLESLDMVVVCGGLRCSVQENSVLTSALRTACKLGVKLGSLWNGAIAIAHAGLLDRMECAVHPDNHPFMAERFPLVSVANRSLVMGDNLATSAGPASAMDMMYQLVDLRCGTELVTAVRDVLSCDQVRRTNNEMAINYGDDPTLPEAVRVVLALMRKHVEEPLTLDELSAQSGLSRRQMERMFQSRMNISPSRFYLRIRLHHAKRLLTQTDDSVLNIAVASGFVSVSHFSNCYRDHFGIPPSVERDKRRISNR